MPSLPPETQLAQAVLHFVQDGAYPDSEDIISANLPPTTFSTLLSSLESARKDVKKELGTLGRHSAGDIDEWIQQAKKLQQDIESAKATAQEIVRHAEQGEQLDNQLGDVAGKKRLLDSEVAFNQTLVDALGLIYEIQTTLDQVETMTSTNRLSEAIDLLKICQGRLGQLGTSQNVTVVRMLKERADYLPQVIGESLGRSWDQWVVVDEANQSISIRHSGREAMIEMDGVVRGLEKLNLLERKVDVLYQALARVLLSPRLDHPFLSSAVTIAIDGDSITVTTDGANSGLGPLFHDLGSMVDFLSTNLPPSIALPLSQTLMSSVSTRLITFWLTPGLPSSLAEMPTFREVLSMVETFIERIDSLGWKGTEGLKDWVQSTPRVWLTKRRETSLELVRTMLKQGLKDTKLVERIETQKVAPDDGMFRATEEDWNAGWSDNDEEKTSPAREEEEEDVSAWGLDEPVDDQGNSESDIHVADDDEVEEAWGWGDEKNNKSTPASPQKAFQPAPNRNGQASKGAKAEKEVTLREHYTITSIPQAILGVVENIIHDAEQLTEQSATDNPIAPAATGLFPLPTLTLAMFRACAPSHYSRHDSGSMYLYNDSLWLAEQLRTVQASAPPSIAKRLKLDADATALEGFGKRAYTKEMEAQRTIIADLLDGAQGFVNSTASPFAEACDTAVSGTVAQITTLERRWKAVLSRSALLQSLGSLLATATNKVILDVEDMPDISETESQRLAAICGRFTALDTLFLPDAPLLSTSTAAALPPTPAATDPIPLTAVYVPSWLRFQYLASILESSLADIKYLWSEGELKLEFSAPEVVELIQALFADSEYRRAAIAEIRRS
ncbi:MAG: hypothetical protein M1838_001860 [Thelocarpon superellum]|nr:MAG: hypothetical protein M1838_001860 [Thelocarpon superellum]